MVTFIQHKDIQFSELIEIAKLKNISWKYTLDSQIDWIEKNVKPWDYHLLINDVAYCHLTPVILYIDNEFNIGYGVGSVCTLEPGKGYGERIMIQINRFLSTNPGILFCHSHVIPFYEKYNWKVVDRNKIMSLINDDLISTMIYGVKNYTKIRYEGRIF